MASLEDFRESYKNSRQFRHIKPQAVKYHKKTRDVPFFDHKKGEDLLGSTENQKIKSEINEEMSNKYKIKLNEVGCDYSLNKSNRWDLDNLISHKTKLLNVKESNSEIKVKKSFQKLNVKKIDDSYLEEFELDEAQSDQENDNYLNPYFEKESKFELNLRDFITA